MKYTTILFDLDGTLTDSREGIFKSIAYALERMQRPCPDEKTLMLFVGPPLSDSFREFCGMDEQQAQTAVKYFRERYETVGWAENKAADGMVELMEKLSLAGCRMAIASSKPERSVIPIAHLFGFDQWMDTCCGSEGKGENKVDVVEKALHRLGVTEETKSSVVLVGDRKFDVEGADLCGLDCIGVEFFGFAPAGELEQAGAVAVCADVQELETFLFEK